MQPSSCETNKFPPCLQILEPLFYLSWVLLRNILYPYLVYVFYQEWQLESAKRGSPWNPILIPPLFQGALSSLNYYWTIEMGIKMMSRVQNKLSNSKLQKHL